MRADAVADADTVSSKGFDRFERQVDARKTIPTNLNIVYVTTMVGLNGCLFVALPLLIAASAWWALLAIPLVLTVPLHWALIHEATHQVLHPNRTVNRLLGRLLAVFFLCPYDVLRFGHLCHHALNGRASDRPELYDPAKTSKLRASSIYYFRLFFGLYAGELACVLISFLPRPLLRRVTRILAYEQNDDSLHMPDVAEKQLTTDERIWPIRFDGALIIGLIVLAFWLYGWWVFLFLGVILSRGALVSLLDNAPHYGTPLGDVKQGHDSRLARPLRFLVLNSNFHGTHHRNPTLPWTALPQQFVADGVEPHGRYLTAPLRQLRGVQPMGDRAAA